MFRFSHVYGFGSGEPGRENTVFVGGPRNRPRKSPGELKMANKKTNLPFEN
jgi:hypothetical protein